MEKNKKKKVLLVIISLLIIVICILLIINREKDNKKTKTEQELHSYVQTLEDGTKLNTSTKLNEIKRIENIEISNAQFTYKDGKTTLLADVKNTGSTKIEMLEIEITLLDENQEEVKKLNGLLGTIKPGETTQLNVSSTSDYSQVYDYKLEIKK